MKKLNRSSLTALIAVIIVVIGAGIAYGKQHKEPSAEELWNKIDGYENWSAFPGTPDDFYEGTRPHGAMLRTYANETAAANPDSLPAGSIIVKENYTPDKKLVAVTVMKKIEGYDTKNKDWYWAKYQPGGEVAMQEGNALAGKVGSCIGCHSSAKGNDYVYVNDE